MSIKKSTSFLLRLGMHIGEHIYQIHPYMFPFLIGFRNKFGIFDINNTYVNLRRAISLIKLIGKTNSYFFIGNSALWSYDWCWKTAFVLYLEKLKKNIGFSTSEWSYGMFTNFHSQFHDVFDIIVRHTKTQKPKTFLWYLSKVIFYLQEMKKKKKISSWTELLVLSKKYWRFFTVYKYYTGFHKLPRVGFIVTPDNDPYPLKEFNRISAPTIYVADSNSTFFGNGYHIFSNDNSLLIYFFLFHIFIKSYFFLSNLY